MIKWLFEIDMLNLSTIETSHDTVSYTRAIIEDSFTGISNRWNIAGNGLIAPNEVVFDISNAYGTYTIAAIENQTCTIKLIMDDVQIRAWKFKIRRAIAYYGKITCYCVDFLQEKLENSEYPNTKNPKDIWPSADDDEEDQDNYCIPVVLGIGYVPARSIKTGAGEDRYYVLGPDTPTYEIHEVSDPRSFPNRSSWDAGIYAMEEYTNSGYKMFQPIIAESVEGEGVDVPGVWQNGNTFFDILCRYSRSDTLSLTNPAQWVQYVLEDFGIASTDIDTVSFAAANAKYSGQSLFFNGGGWWRKEPREKILSNLLAQTDSFIKCTDKIELYQFDKTPKETITNVLSESFSPSMLTKTNNDSGRVQWPEAFDKPQDVLNGKTVVPTYYGGTEDTPSSEILHCRFLAGQSINAQKAGILFFQKKYEQNQRVSFSIGLTKLVNQGTLSPGHVITVNNSLYGGTSNVIITDMHIDRELKVNISGVTLNHLEDWDDLTSVAVKTVVATSTGGYQMASTNYSGNISTNWDFLLNIPPRFSEDADLGLNVTDSYLGYYDGVDFKSYIDANGLFQFYGNANNYINWNGTTLNVVGNIFIKNPSGVRTDLNVANGATVGATWGVDINGQPSAVVQTFYQSTAPISGVATGDFWIDSDSDKHYRYNGISWTEVQDEDISQALLDAATAQSTADGKVFTFFQTTAPIADGVGDLWFDTDDNNKPYRWDGSTWVSAEFDVATWSKISGTGKPADNADVTQTILDAGAAIDNAIANGTTLMSGGYIQTSLLNVSNIIATGSILVAGDADKTQTVINAGLVTTGTISLNDGSTIKAGITAEDVGDESVRIWAGASHASRTSAKFRVTQGGALTATDATITGAITATSGSFSGEIASGSGSIGGFSIGSNLLAAGSGSSKISLSTVNGIHLGANDFASAPFSVTQAGTLYAKNANIEGELKHNKPGTDMVISAGSSAETAYMIFDPTGSTATQALFGTTTLLGTPWTLLVPQPTGTTGTVSIGYNISNRRWSTIQLHCATIDMNVTNKAMVNDSKILTAADFGAGYHNVARGDHTHTTAVYS